MNRARFIISVVAVLLCACTVFVVTRSKNPDEGREPEKQQLVVRIGGPKNIAMLPLIAVRRGYFRDAGVSVKFEPLQSGKIAMDALNSGDIDLAVLVDSNIAFVRFQGGDDIRVICTIQEKYDDAIVARVDRGIREPGDLVGKRIGFVPATTSHMSLVRYLAFKGIDVGQVTLVPMTPPAMQPALIRGDVDAISIWQPFRYNVAKELGAGGVEFNDKAAYVAFALVAGRAEFLSKHRAECQKVFEALLRAEKFVNEDREEAVDILAEEIPMPHEALAAAWPEYDVRMRLDAALLRLLEEEGRWIKATQEGFADKEVPNYRTAIDDGLLKSVAPDRVESAP